MWKYVLTVTVDGISPLELEPVDTEELAAALLAAAATVADDDAFTEAAILLWCAA